MSVQPELPEPHHANLDSMLSRKFGREVANYFSGSPLNRLSFLRTDNKFLTAAIRHPSTSFLLLNALAPLTNSPSSLHHASHADVLPLIGDDPYSLSEEELIAAYNSVTPIIPQILFLGIDESDNSSSSSSFSYTNYSGKPYFALDVTPKDSHSASAAIQSLISAKESAGKTFLQGRAHLTLTAPEAAIYAQARSLLDWNARNPFCAGCGQPTLSVHAGFKRTCPPTDWASVSGGATPNAGPSSSPEGAAKSPSPRAACATRGVVSNLSFPRTDPTIIVAVLSADSSKILLGRQRRWPPYWYSTLAGFLEPAESIEEAVRREVWEESGVAVGRVQIHSTQPWPYPANLMVGAVAQAVPGPEGEEISLKHDPELEAARWFGIEEVREALRVGIGALDDMGRKEAGYVEGNLRLPPKTAIANRLLDAVVNGGWSGVGGEKL